MNTANETWSILRELYDSEEGAYLSDILQDLDISKSDKSRIKRKLKRNGWIKNKGFFGKIIITEKGKKHTGDYGELLQGGLVPNWEEIQQRPSSSTKETRDYNWIKILKIIGVIVSIVSGLVGIFMAYKEFYNS